ELETVIERDTKSHQEKLDALVAAREELTKTFKVLANDLLEAQTKALSETNAREIGTLLNPLRERIAEFKTKVEEIYVTEGKERATLGAQVMQLADLNRTLSKDAQGLAEALKGSSMTRGKWGEFVLESTLEAAGLRKGHEYQVQESARTDEGKTLRPDVTVDLPGGRKVVIDSKVSLNAYTDYIDATDDEARRRAATNVVASVSNHISSLASKSYQTLHGGETLDFVIMFVPLEGAFHLAVQTKPSILDEAWSKGVMFAGPTTILLALKIIKHFWDQNRQAQNALEIATAASGLYDKFVKFTEDLDKIGLNLNRAVEAHQDAKRALTSERGNIIRRIETLRTLGVRTRRSLPRSWTDIAGTDMPSLPDGDTAEDSEAIGNDAMDDSSDASA
ncbi:MAG: DNA recombination protein RmuC, partial [Actinobacteria bacterium]|nr:DNA recombination protein RmuC [Actinomycetota bacterium]